MPQIYNKPEMKNIRRLLRNNAPTAERILWQQLQGKKFKGLKFRRQYSVDRYSVDFYCASLRLAIELDGENHLDHCQQKKDKDRQEAIENLGIKIIRFWNTDIFNNLEGVFIHLDEYTDELI